MNPAKDSITRRATRAIARRAREADQARRDASNTCPLCGRPARNLTSLGVCPWCDNTQGETPDPDSDLGRFLSGRGGTD